MKFLKKLRIFFSGTGVSPPARAILVLGISLSCFLLSLSLIIAVYAGDLTPHTYKLHYLYAELYRVPQGILLICFLAALICDDLSRQ